MIVWENFHLTKKKIFWIQLLTNTILNKEKILKPRKWVKKFWLLDQDLLESSLVVHFPVINQLMLRFWSLLPRPIRDQRFSNRSFLPRVWIHGHTRLGRTRGWTNLKLTDRQDSEIKKWPMKGLRASISNWWTMGWSKNWPCWRLRSQTFISLSWFMDQWTKRSWNRTSKLSIRQGHPILFQTTTNGQISWRIHRSHENSTKISCQHECYQGQHCACMTHKYESLRMSHRMYKYFQMEFNDKTSQFHVKTENTATKVHKLQLNGHICYFTQTP